MCLWWETGIEKNASSDFLLKKIGAILVGKEKRKRKRLVVHDLCF
jgi:hypothetical protein